MAQCRRAIRQLIILKLCVHEAREPHPKMGSFQLLKGSLEGLRLPVGLVKASNQELVKVMCVCVLKEAMSASTY